MGSRRWDINWWINKSEKVVGGLEVCDVECGTLFIVSTFIYDSSIGY